MSVFVLGIFVLCEDSEQTRVLLTSAAYVHLKHAEVSKFTRNLSPASRAILLSGPAGLSLFSLSLLSLVNICSKVVIFALGSDLFVSIEELYQQMLAKALAHYFEAKLLLLDITDFSLKVKFIHFITFLWGFFLFELLFNLVFLMIQIQGKYGTAVKEHVSFLTYKTCDLNFSL